MKILPNFSTFVPFPFWEILDETHPRSFYRTTRVINARAQSGCASDKVVPRGPIKPSQLFPLALTTSRVNEWVRTLLTVSFGQRSRKAGSCYEWEIGQKGKQRKKNSVKWIESIAYLVCFLFTVLLLSPLDLCLVRLKQNLHSFPLAYIYMHPISIHYLSTLKSHRIFFFFFFVLIKIILYFFKFYIFFFKQRLIKRGQYAFQKSEIQIYHFNLSLI